MQTSARARGTRGTRCTRARGTGRCCSHHRGWCGRRCCCCCCCCRYPGWCRHRCGGQCRPSGRVSSVQVGFPGSSVVWPSRKTIVVLRHGGMVHREQRARGRVGICRGSCHCPLQWEKTSIGKEKKKRKIEVRPGRIGVVTVGRITTVGWRKSSVDPRFWASPRPAQHRPPLRCSAPRFLLLPRGVPDSTQQPQCSESGRCVRAPPTGSESSNSFAVWFVGGAPGQTAQCVVSRGERVTDRRTDGLDPLHGQYKDDEERR